MLLFFPAEDPALIGRCYRRLVAPLSGPTGDQDLRVVAPVVRLSDVAAAEVGIAVSHVLLPFGIFLHAADEIPAREILLGVTEIFPRHAEVLGGAATMVVAAMVMMTMMTMMTVVVVVVVVVVEDIVQETSDKTSRKTWQQAEHCILHCR